VHTRALHAEENAFLQLAKYGGIGIVGGKLYTTASPCELCAKKAYQLGISEVVFIDPYPGITQDHIINIGTMPPKLIQFRGAIGKAYHRLYEQIIPIKDDLDYMLK
ncbi:deoxycytidylate deaminase, partial [Citrobacter freundii]